MLLRAASLTCDPQYTQLTVLTKLYQTGFPQALEIMENVENHEKKIHAWKSHDI